MGVDEGWWTGYPEMQFYPPAFAYAGALLHIVAFGALTIQAAYHARCGSPTWRRA